MRIGAMNLSRKRKCPRRSKSMKPLRSWIPITMNCFSGMRLGLTPAAMNPKHSKFSRRCLHAINVGSSWSIACRPAICYRRMRSQKSRPLHPNRLIEFRLPALNCRFLSVTLFDRKSADRSAFLHRERPEAYEVPFHQESGHLEPDRRDDRFPGEQIFQTVLGARWVFPLLEHRNPEATGS